MEDHLIHGDCLEIIQTLEDNSISVCITDPPFGTGYFDFDGDENTIESFGLLLKCLQALEPKLKRNAHVAFFWTSKDLDLAIDALRMASYTFRRMIPMHLPKGKARPYLAWLPRFQPIVIGQKYLGCPPKDFHTEMATYFHQKLEESGLKKADIAKQLNCDSRLVTKWTRVNDPSWCIITPRFYLPLKKILNLDDRFDNVLLERVPISHTHRDDFEYQHDLYQVTEYKEEILHPCMKPYNPIRHLVMTLAKENEVVIDPFMGSGTTCLACKNTNRRYIGIEKDAKFYEVAKNRIESI